MSGGAHDFAKMALKTSILASYISIVNMVYNVL